jgi:hypothetical protein
MCGLANGCAVKPLRMPRLLSCPRVAGGPLVPDVGQGS